MKYKQSIRKISIPSAAKINLHLSVLGKRTDGFHELLTVMSRLDLFDLVTLERTDVKNELSCRCLGFEELDGEKNLAFKAVEFWRKETGLSFGIKIIIRKRIPPEAGLGGGSSNAMATLVGLNHWLFDPLEQSVLHRIGSNLGSDCPFFLYNDCCVAEGRGEKIRRLRIPATRNLHGQQVFLFKPPIGLATAEVFQSTKEDKKYDEKERQKLFVLKPLYQRAIIVAAGPIANFLLAILIFFMINVFVGKDFTPPMISEVTKESPAYVAGLEKNDVILSIDKNEVKSILDVSKFITMSTSEFIDFKVSRYDKEILIKVKPQTLDGEDNLGNKIKKRTVGIKIIPYQNTINHQKLGPAKAIYYSVSEVYYVTTSTLKYLGSIIAGSGDSSQLGGPIRIAKISGQVAEFGILPFLSMMAYISISLGLINLFPIPLLDGGHLMFYGFEKVLGKPLSQKTQEGFFRIGMFLLLSLMFFATMNDLRDLGLF